MIVTAEPHTRLNQPETYVRRRPAPQPRVVVAEASETPEEIRARHENLENCVLGVALPPAIFAAFGTGIMLVAGFEVAIERSPASALLFAFLWFTTFFPLGLVCRGLLHGSTFARTAGLFFAFHAVTTAPTLLAFGTDSPWGLVFAPPTLAFGLFSFVVLILAGKFYTPEYRHVFKRTGGLTRLQAGIWSCTLGLAFGCGSFLMLATWLFAGVS